MSRNYKEYLEQQLAQAQQEFEEAKASATKDIEGMDPLSCTELGSSLLHQDR